MSGWNGPARAGSSLPTNLLDSTFGIGGVVRTDLPTADEEITDLAVQADGKILALGSASGRFVILRYLSDGNLDPDFHVTTQSFGTAVALQPDQRIILAGEFGESPNEGFGLKRFNPDGTIDTTFGRNGSVLTHFPVGVVVADVTVQDDGKILAAGEAFPFGTGVEGFAFARYLPNGRLDGSFGSNGRTLVRLSSDQHYLARVAIQPDGKVVANGYLTEGTDDPLCVVRLLSDGALDPTFGTGGTVIMTGLGFFATTGLALQTDGGILSGGPGPEGFAVVRHLPDGTLDSSFGVGGITQTSFNGLSDRPEDLAVQPNGLIIQFGWSADEGDENDLASAWYNPDGSVYSQTNPTLFGFTSFGYAATVQADGKPIVAGGGGSGFFQSEFGLARYLSS
jgi:uncharacterized delta-60 repeat protein